MASSQISNCCSIWSVRATSVPRRRRLSLSREWSTSRSSSSDRPFVTLVTSQVAEVYHLAVVAAAMSLQMTKRVQSLERVLGQEEAGLEAEVLPEDILKPEMMISILEVAARVDRGTVISTRTSVKGDEAGVNHAPGSSGADPSRGMLAIGPSEALVRPPGPEVEKMTGTLKALGVDTAPLAPGASHLRAAHLPRQAASSNALFQWAACVERAARVARTTMRVLMSRSSHGSQAMTMFGRRNMAMSTALTFLCVT